MGFPLFLLPTLFCIPGFATTIPGMEPTTFGFGLKCQRVFRDFNNIGGDVRTSLNEYFSVDDGYIDSVISGHKIWVISRGGFHNKLIDFRQNHSVNTSLREVQIEGFGGTADHQRQLIEFSVSEAFRWDLGEGCVGVKLDQAEKVITVSWESSKFNQLQSGWPRRIGPYVVKIELVSSKK